MAARTPAIGRSARILAPILLLAVAASCVRSVPRTTVEPSAKVNISELWEEPTELARRDLLHGPGGIRLAPDPSAAYTFEKADTSGYSKGYDVVAPDGRKWSVKIGPEAKPEVASSRVLWAIGYHQPVVYYVPHWTLVGAVSGRQEHSRFRLEDPNQKVVGDWSWYENEFVGTRPFGGLIVANLILNNWDWKTSNNKIVEYQENGVTGRLYMVRDLGASLGKTSYPSWVSWTFLRWKQGTRNDVAGFESQNLIKRVRGDRVEFDYRGRYQSLVDTVTPADVVWTCQLMARLSDQQWHDAFRAAGYSPDEVERYVRKVKSKIQEGLALGASTSG